MIIFNINIRNWIQNILKSYFENNQTSIEFVKLNIKFEQLHYIIKVGSKCK